MADSIWDNIFLVKRGTDDGPVKYTPGMDTTGYRLMRDGRNTPEQIDAVTKALGVELLTYSGWGYNSDYTSVGEVVDSTTGKTRAATQAEIDSIMSNPAYTSRFNPTAIAKTKEEAAFKASNPSGYSQLMEFMAKSPGNTYKSLDDAKTAMVGNVKDWDAWFTPNVTDVAATKYDAKLGHNTPLNMGRRIQLPYQLYSTSMAELAKRKGVDISKTTPEEFKTQLRDSKEPKDQWQAWALDRSGTDPYGVAQILFGAQANGSNLETIINKVPPQKAYEISKEKDKGPGFLSDPKTYIQMVVSAAAAVAGPAIAAGISDGLSSLGDAAIQTLSSQGVEAGAQAGSAVVANAGNTAFQGLLSESLRVGNSVADSLSYAAANATVSGTVGAAVPGMLINSGSQLATTGELDWKQLAASGVGSIAAPVVGGAYSDFGVTNPVLNAGLTGATMNAVGQLATTGNVNWQQAGVSGLLSGVTAAGKNSVGDFTKGSYESRQSTPVYDANGQYIGENTAHGFEPGFNAPGAAQSNQDLFDLNHLNNPGVYWNPDAKIDPYADPYSYDSQADAGYKYDPYGDIPGSGTGMPNGNKVGYGSGNGNYGNVIKAALGLFGGSKASGGMMGGGGGGGGDTGSLATASPSRGLNYHNPNVRQQPQVDPYAQYLSSRLGQSRDFGLLGYGNLA